MCFVLQVDRKYLRNMRFAKKHNNNKKSLEMNKQNRRAEKPQKEEKPKSVSTLLSRYNEITVSFHIFMRVPIPYLPPTQLCLKSNFFKTFLAHSLPFECLMCPAWSYRECIFESSILFLLCYVRRKQDSFKKWNSNLLAFVFQF